MATNLANAHDDGSETLRIAAKENMINCLPYSMCEWRETKHTASQIAIAKWTLCARCSKQYTRSNVLFGVTSVQRNLLQVQFTSQIYSRHDVLQLRYDARVRRHRCHRSHRCHRRRHRRLRLQHRHGETAAVRTLLTASGLLALCRRARHRGRRRRTTVGRRDRSWSSVQVVMVCRLQRRRLNELSRQRR